MKIEPKKLGYFQKKWLSFKFPKLPDESGKFITISTSEYELMKNIMDRDYRYLTQILEHTKEIRDLKEKINEKEKAIRKLAGKIGGMQKELNKCKQKNQ